MFSIVFPGQGSQFVGMAKDLHDKFDLVKNLFNSADEILNYNISKIILDGPSEDLNSTENTQPAIFLISYSIFKLLEKEFNINLSNAKFYAGHSLGEYSALACANSLNFEDSLSILRIRGKAMQNAVQKGKGAMLAILGSSINDIEELILMNKNTYKCYIANDNSNQQIVVSGLNPDIEKFSVDLKKKKIKSIKLAVSAPFHCQLMNSATKILENELDKINFKNPSVPIISNVTAKPVFEREDIKHLLIEQIESQVRWRESINFMINQNIKQIIEIGPGKVLSNLIKRIDNNIKVSSINNVDDIKSLNI